MGKLDGKVAIVSGAAAGIGRAAAELFVREGARVLLVDRDDGVESVARALGERAACAVADVSSEADTVRYVGSCLEHFGGIDVLFANAGIEGTFTPVTALPVEALDRVLAVNVRGAFLAIKHAAPKIAERGGGSIVVTSSVAGLVGAPGLAAYVASKHAVIGLVRSAALELAGSKIRVNALNPGPIDNRMMRSIEEQAAPGAAEAVKASFEEKVPLHRYGTNDEIARFALFLASDDASYCTGNVYIADGGMLAS